MPARVHERMTCLLQTLLMVGSLLLSKQPLALQQHVGTLLADVSPSRKKSKRGRGQDSDEAYTDDEEEDISDVDSDDDRSRSLRSLSQGPSGDDMSGESPAQHGLDC